MDLHCLPLFNLRMLCLNGLTIDNTSKLVTSKLFAILNYSTIFNLNIWTNRTKQILQTLTEQTLNRQLCRWSQGLLFYPYFNQWVLLTLTSRLESNSVLDRKFDFEIVFTKINLIFFDTEAMTITMFIQHLKHFKLTFLKFLYNICWHIMSWVTIN